MMPPTLAVSLRPQTHTHKNIMINRAFTVSIPRASQALIVDTLGTISGKKVDKFELTGLTPVRSDKVQASYAEEFPVVMECEVVGTADLGSHTMFVGEIVGVLVDDKLTNGESLPDLAQVDPLVFSPGDYAYYSVRPEPVGLAFRMAKSKQEPVPELSEPVKSESESKTTGVVVTAVVAILITILLPLAIMMMRSGVETIGKAAIAGGFMSAR